MVSVKRWYYSKTIILNGLKKYCSFFIALPVLISSTHLGHAQQYYDYDTGQFTNSNQYDNVQASPIGGNTWSTIIGGSLSLAPNYDGDNGYGTSIAPIISIGQYGFGSRFISHLDNMSFSFIETNAFRFGLNGKIIGGRDQNDADDLIGLKKVKFGGEIGGFAELYPVDNIRLRAELRYGLLSHHAITSNLSMDVFKNISPKMQVSAGPRAFYATRDYFNTFYGVDATESAQSHLPQFYGESGFGSYGFGGEIAWRTTDNLTFSVFGEYKRLTGSAADSSLVRFRGNKNQANLGVAATYRFDSTK